MTINFSRRSGRCILKPQDNLIAQTNVYKKIPNPSWKVDRKLINKLIKLATKLPSCNEGIPDIFELDKSGCLLSDANGILLAASDGIVLLYINNIIEVKSDADGQVENAILNSAPEIVYKEICHYI